MSVGRKVIITNESDLPMAHAIQMVLKVIEGGRISGESFCYVTTFENGHLVYAYTLKSGDGFKVMRIA